MLFISAGRVCACAGTWQFSVSALMCKPATVSRCLWEFSGSGFLKCWNELLTCQNKRMGYLENLNITRILKSMKTHSVLHFGISCIQYFLFIWLPMRQSPGRRTTARPATIFIFCLFIRLCPHFPKFYLTFWISIFFFNFDVWNWCLKNVVGSAALASFSRSLMTYRAPSQAGRGIVRCWGWPRPHGAWGCPPSWASGKWPVCRRWDSTAGPPGERSSPSGFWSIPWIVRKTGRGILWEHSENLNVIRLKTIFLNYDLMVGFHHR